MPAGTTRFVKTQTLKTKKNLTLFQYKKNHENFKIFDHSRNALETNLSVPPKWVSDFKTQIGGEKKFIWHHFGFMTNEIFQNFWPPRKLIPMVLWYEFCSLGHEPVGQKWSDIIWFS